MKECFVSGHTLPQAYHQALVVLSEHGNLTPVPDYNTNQKELAMTFYVEDPKAEPRISRLFYGDAVSLEEYRQEMIDGIFDFEVEVGKLPYTYHHRMKGQIEWVIDELRRNPDSRRAVIDVRSPEDMGIDSPACLQHMQFFIREGVLHLKVLIRSNDAVKASFMNAFGFISFQEYIANRLGLPVGSYTHRANSFHVYERDFKMMEGYVKRIKGSLNRQEEVTYSYLGDYQDQMWEAREAVAEKVKDLKAKALVDTVGKLGGALDKAFPKEEAGV